MDGYLREGGPNGTCVRAKACSVQPCNRTQTADCDSLCSKNGTIGECYMSCKCQPCTEDTDCSTQCHKVQKAQVSKCVDGQCKCSCFLTQHERFYNEKRCPDSSCGDPDPERYGKDLKYCRIEKQAKGCFCDKISVRDNSGKCIPKNTCPARGCRIGDQKDCSEACWKNKTISVCQTLPCTCRNCTADSECSANCALEGAYGPSTCVEGKCQCSCYAARDKQVFSMVKRCPDNTCSEPLKYGVDCSAEQKSTGCFCGKGYVLDETTGKCVLKRRCSCTQEQSSNCTSDCWTKKDKTFGTCLPGNSCTCSPCQTDSKCNSSCVLFEGADGGVCKNGKCECTFNCTIENIHGRFCKPCCSKIMSKNGYDGGFCGDDDQCFAIPYTADTCSDFCAPNGASGDFCDDETCVCKACNNTICNSYCSQTPGKIGRCVGLNSKCLCFASDPNHSSRKCDSDFCKTRTLLSGLVHSCSINGIKPTSPCSTMNTACGQEYCNDTCKKIGRGNGTCTTRVNNVYRPICNCMLLFFKQSNNSCMMSRG